MKIGSTVACIYKEDEEWYFGRIADLDDIREEIKIEFLHPKGCDGLLTGYKFPRRIDSTWVECNCILKIVETLQPTTNRTVRMYKPSIDELNDIELLFTEYIADA